MNLKSLQNKYLKKLEVIQIVVVRSRTKLVKELIEKADNCKIIARVGVGLDNIDQERCKGKEHQSN